MVQIQRPKLAWSEKLISFPCMSLNPIPLWGGDLKSCVLFSPHPNILDCSVSTHKELPYFLCFSMISLLRYMTPHWGHCLWKDFQLLHICARTTILPWVTAYFTLHKGDMFGGKSLQHGNIGSKARCVGGWTGMGVKDRKMYVNND